MLILLSNPQNATLADGTGSGLIIDDDPDANLSINDAAAIHDAEGKWHVPFAVSLDGISGQTINVNYATQDGSAIAGKDYQSASGTLTLNPGETNKTVLVEIPDLASLGATKTFALLLSNATHAAIADGEGIGTITGGARPEISIADTSLNEGDSGWTNAAFQVSLSRTSSLPVSVSYFTSDVTAKAGIDYQETKGAATIIAGRTNATILVPVAGNVLNEPDKIFKIQLHNATNADLVVSQAVGVIQNDDNYSFIPPMTVVLTAPLNRTVFPYDSRNGISFFITANVDAPGRKIVRVDFYRGSVYVASSEYGPEYSVVWYGVIPVGTYSLTAKAIDSQGNVAVSAPVVISMSDTWRNVAIVHSTADPEIAVLRQYLYEMGLSTAAFKRETINADSLNPFDMVIWHGGTASMGGEHDLDLIQDLAAKPVYFIGDNLLTSGKALTEEQRKAWNGALHMQNPGAPLAGGMVDLDSSAQSVFSGRYGVASHFYCAGNMENARAAADAAVMARSATSDILVAYPKPNAAGVKTIAQVFRVAADSFNDASREPKKTLFQNGVNWLLDGPTCGSNIFTLQMDGPKGAVQVGQDVVYTIWASQKGDCTATGVTVTNLLSPFVEFKSAELYSGSYSLTNGMVVFDLGLLNTADTVEMKITATPREPGEIIDIVSIRGNGGVFDKSSWATNKFNIAGSARPVLRVNRLTSGKPELQLSGSAGSVYWIQESTNLLDWLNLTNTVQGSLTLPLPVDPGLQKPRRFYRAKGQ